MGAINARLQSLTFRNRFTCDLQAKCEGSFHGKTNILSRPETFEMKPAPSLTTDPISSLIWRIALPMSIGMFFNTMFNVVDTY